MIKPVRAWERQMTQLTSASNVGDLIAPSGDKVTPLAQNGLNSEVPVVKRDSVSVIGNVPQNTTGDTINNPQNNTINNIGGVTSPSVIGLNTYGSPYGGYGSSTGGYGGNYGGYGSSMGGYGGYGSSMGGYGSSYGGYGSSYGGYGSSYGGMGGMYGSNMSPYNRINPNEQAGLLDRCFMIVERLNFQMFHFCEMTRMIQAQSASLAFFLDIMTKVYNWTKNFITQHSKSIYEKSRLSVINTCIKIKKILNDFFLRNDLKDSKLKSHIKVLDYMISIILLTALAGIFLKIF